MSKNSVALPHHYLVTVEGTFYAKNDSKGKDLIRYNLQVKVPYKVTAPFVSKTYNNKTGEYDFTEEMKVQKIDDIGILSFLLRTKFLHNELKKLNGNFVGLRTHEITNTERSSNDIPMPSNPECLSRPDLKQYIKSNHMDIDINLFPQLKDLRNAVLNYREDPTQYKTFETKWKLQHGADAAFLKAMELLNPETTEEVKSTPEI